MSTQIAVREAVTETEIAVFWEQLRAYFARDIFRDPEDKDRDYFLSGTEYQENIQKLHDRPQDRCHYLFFHRDGEEIGFAMPVIYTTEDGKCLILEYCVYPKFRGGGAGRECARALLGWAKENGAFYAELNYGGNERRLRFWESVGFIQNGVDEWGEPLLMLPPKEDVPITAEILHDPEDWQIKKLVNGHLQEHGRQPLDEEKQERLRQLIQDGRITFFVAKRGYRAVGMCCVKGSVSDSNLPEGIYVEPVFRNKGVEQKLVQAVRDSLHR